MDTFCYRLIHISQGLNKGEGAVVPLGAESNDKRQRIRGNV